MKWMMIIAAIALAGCMQEDHPYAGSWKSKYGDEAIEVSRNGDCRWFLGDGYGLQCEISGDTLKVKRNGAFMEAGLNRISNSVMVDDLYVRLPGGGMQVYVMH